jgi:hypothetical protein
MRCKKNKGDSGSGGGAEEASKERAKLRIRPGGVCSRIYTGCLKPLLTKYISLTVFLRVTHALKRVFFSIFLALSLSPNSFALYTRSLTASPDIFAL